MKDEKVGRAAAMPSRGRLHAGVLAALTGLGMMTPVHAQPVEARQHYSIPAGDLGTALDQLASQAQLQLIYPGDLVRGKRARALDGRQTWREALERLLEGTGLTWGMVNDSNVVIRRVEAASTGDARSSGSRGKVRSEKEEDIAGMPAIMVQGARTLNTDITRTEDDPQPYVVFDRDLIERSGATSLEQLLQQRLPMNTSVASMGGGASLDRVQPGSSNINLRGLGAAQTLILIDGHRMSSSLDGGNSTQGEISGIPLAAIERIEILPSTASGIYGGSATGGVINIITRKDYSGGEVRMTYDNTFGSDSAVRKLDFVFGHHFNQGRTNVLVSAGYSDANTLTEADRGFISRGRAHARHNNPDYSIGIPPLGRRPNFASVDGSDLVLKSGVALGSPYGSVPAGYGGVATDGGAALAANAGRYDWSLPEGPAGLGRVLYNEPTLKNGGLVLRHQFNDGLQAFADLSSSESRRQHSEGEVIWFGLDADSPYNPFTTHIQGMAAPPVLPPNQTTTRRDRAVAGAIKQLPADWQMSLDYTWDRTRMDFIMAGALDLGMNIDAGSVDILRDLTAFPLVAAGSSLYVNASMQSTMRDANVRFSGPLGSLPGGRPILSAALAHREESSPDSWWTYSSGLGLFFPARSTSVSSAYMEYRVPLFSEANARPGLRELELQLAVRREEYASRSAEMMLFFGGVPSPLPDVNHARNEFSSTDPTIALRWKPIEDLTLRMSYGTGFLAPALNNLASAVTPSIDLSYVVDPRRGNASLGNVRVIHTGNPGLQPESSRSWSAGMIFAPSRLSGLRMSVDYTRIEKTDNIGYIPGDYQGTVDRESLFPELVVRGPNLPGDPPGWPGPITQVSSIPLNLARLELEAWDVQFDYRLDTEARGSFDLFLAGTWQPRYAIQVLSGEPMLDYVGMGSTNPLEFKANAGVTWNRSAWRVGWNLNHFGAYRLVEDWNVQIASQGNGGRVPSQTYQDAFANYDFALSGVGGIPDWLARTQVQLGIRNLFNKRPPVDMAAMSGYAYYSPFGSPRLASYYLTVTTRF